MRCVCGRALHPSWREWLFAGVVVVCLSSMLRAERERRELRADRHIVQTIAAEGRVTLDSLRMLRCALR